MKKLLLSTLLILAFTIAKGQVIPKDILERVNNSQYIFEGKVIRSNAYYTQDHKMIYTSSTIDIYKIFKGTINCGTIEVITRGGCVGDECIKISDNLVLKPGMMGIFLCSPTQKELPLVDYFPETNTIALDFPYDLQGYIKYFDDFFNKQVVDYQYSLDSLAQVYDLMELYTQLNFVDCHGSIVSDHHSIERVKQIKDPNQEVKDFMDGLKIFRSQADTLLTYTLLNAQVTGTGPKYFEFDIGLSDNFDPLYFISGFPKFHFDSLAYGSMLKLNHKITVTNIGPLSDTVNSYIPATITDIQRDNFGVGISYRNPAVFSPTFVNLTSTPTPCVHVKIEVSDCSRSGYINQIYGGWPYYFPKYSVSSNVGPSTSYNDFDITSSVYSPGCGSVQIISIRPDTVNGGVGDTVTITGNHFGTRSADSKIYLKNADDGGLTYLSLNNDDIKDWNDSLIKFVMPGIVDSSAIPNNDFGTPGSGTIKIQTDVLDSAVGMIQVFFSLESTREDSVTKAPDTPFDFTITHQYEGLQFHLDTSIYRHQDRRTCVEKAIKDWVCMTQMRITIIDTMTTNSLTASRDTTNMIQFGHLAWPKLAETIRYISPGTPGCDNYYYRTDLIINDTLIPVLFCDTNTCDSLPHNLYDLYSILLHEFGHVHGLNHVNDPRALMYFSTDKGQNPYTESSDRQVWINYDQSAYSGGMKVMSNALNPSLLLCYTGGALVSPLVLSDCSYIHREMYSSDCHSVIGIDEIDQDLGVRLYPNPASEQLTIEFNKKREGKIKIEIGDLCGRIIMPSTIITSDNLTNIDISMLNQGIFLLKFVSEHSTKGILFVKN